MKISLAVKKLSVKILLTLLVFPAGAFFAHAGMLDDLKNGKAGAIDAAADNYEYVGDNIVATGHVVIRLMGMQLTADKAIINPISEDIEMKGHVVFSMQKTERKNVSIEEYEDLCKNPFKQVTLVEYVMSPSGRQQLSVDVTHNEASLQAERAAGSLKTGILQFRDFKMKAGILYCSGKEAERLFDGKITVRDATFSTCEYLQDDHEHYAVFSKKATINPREADRGLFNYNADQGEHTVWAYNNFIEIFGVPCLWLPVMHKPSDISMFGGKIEFGAKSEWGWYIRAAKNFQLLEEPYLNANLLFDYYSERGFGYGIGLDFLTPESSTEAFFYGLRDWHPYYYWKDDDDFSTRWAENKSRLEIPNYRYEFRLVNMTHLLPRLDFRAQLDVLSDYNFLDEFFPSRYNSLLEPPTYASLEYQADRFTASVFTNIRVNSFFTTVQRLPEIRLDFQRQELFQNIYYQGETTFDYLSMKWREFDRETPYSSYTYNKNYETFRFDTLHMFYYPFKLFNINLIPRAGVRLTAYSRSSDRAITYDDLNKMFTADAVDGMPSVWVKHYDGDGGAQLRVAAEIGIEANTKFYRSWQDVKNAYWDLDGLRHVIQPYVNYTFIPKTNVSADYLYYFDEIDRIEEQNVIRLGLINRLQTRRNNQIEELVSLENYWDYYFHKTYGMNSIGDFGTIFRFNPGAGLTFTSELLLDLGQNNDHDYQVTRGKSDAGRPGLDWKYINRWYNTLSWQFAPDWRIYGSYDYTDEFNYRTPYSMGSMYSSIASTTMYLNRFQRSQNLSAGIDFPLIFDKYLKGKIQFTYDIDAALMKNVSFGLSRRFHCIIVSAAAGWTTERRGTDNDKSSSYFFSFYVSLADLPQIGIGSRNGQ